MTPRELVETLKAATGPNRKLDEALAQLILKWGPVGTAGVPPYTGSVDMALTLKPKGPGYILRDYGDGAASARLCRPPRGVAKGKSVVAATPALALCLAIVDHIATEGREE